MSEISSLISCQELAERLNDPHLVCLEAVFFLPNTPFAAGKGVQHRIPRARYFDIEDIADSNNPLPHMVPSEDDFAKNVSALGIANDTTVVCYDQFGLFSAGRVWWMFRLFGHEKVMILDGGMKHWRQLGLPTQEAGQEAITPTDYVARFNPDYYAHKHEVYAAIEDSTSIVDARPAERFAGHAPEPREGMRAGHMPGAHNIPFGQLTDPETGKLRNREELEELYSVAPNDSRTIFSCGSGITAAAVLFAAEQIGRMGRVYDGSWVDWGTDPETPIETS